MDNSGNKSLIKNAVSVTKTITEHITEDFSPIASKIFKPFLFITLLLSVIILAPFVIIYKKFKKYPINPFFMLRTELETKWYKGKKEEALEQLRNVNEAIRRDERQIFTSGVNISPYGKFKFNDYWKVLWLLYHWEFQSGELDRASEICDYFISHYDTFRSRKVTKQLGSKYLSQWVVNKAEVILKQKGSMAAQQFLLKYIDPEDIANPVNKLLYELRDNKEKIV